MGGNESCGGLDRRPCGGRTTQIKPTSLSPRGFIIKKKIIFVAKRTIFNNKKDLLYTWKRSERHHSEHMTYKNPTKVPEVLLLPVLTGS